MNISKRKSAGLPKTNSSKLFGIKKKKSELFMLPFVPDIKSVFLQVAATLQAMSVIANRAQVWNSFLVLFPDP